MDTAGLPTRLVFTDVDETLINCRSMFDFLDYYMTGRHGAAGTSRARQLRESLLVQASQGIPREETNRAYFRAWAGERAEDVARWGERWFAERSADGSFYLASTRKALVRHQAGGAAIVLVSGSFPALLDPIARDVRADHVLCTRPEEFDGELTGGLLGDPLVGSGKAEAVRSTIAGYPHLDPADCYGYGDHISDLPMLSAVGHPVVVGRNPELLAQLPTGRQL
ncbi:HAD family hydrolase [Kitasatospora sp. NPDC057542]|uniref:HAD family hydrolase n=1 Tax=Streptomycetaceae TaxID=2062 RepID=UPI001CCC9D9C|nr:HAD-IB family hydrolase [Streptomyces sp. LS1784]